MTCCCSSWVTLLQTRSSLPEFLRARESSLRNQVTIPASKLAAGGGAVCHVYPTRAKGTMCFLGKVQLAMRCTITTAVLTNQVPQKKYNQRHNQRIFDPCNCSQIQLKYSMPKISVTNSLMLLWLVWPWGNNRSRAHSRAHSRALLPCQFQ